MADSTKIELSNLELELMKNSLWILTKHSVIDKIALLFSEQVPYINQHFLSVASKFEEINTSRPKITKGERYQNLPYIILDYPAVFSKQDIFALRTMVLWGSFLSVSLHLSGKYKDFFQENIYRKLQASSDNIFLAIGENQWQHHITPESFLQISNTNNSLIDEYIKNHPYTKITSMFKLEEAKLMDKNIKKACSYLAGVLN